jgi:mRNA-degrading endonuclease RelE of RelBE toxin-antitoxin system
VRATLLSESLHPLRLPNGRAVLAFVVTRKRMVTAGSGASALVLPAYADLVISAVVTAHPLSMAGSALVLAGVRRTRLGAFVLQMPLTDPRLCDAGRSSLGMPAFVADFDFEERPDAVNLRVSADGEAILSVAASPGGRPHWRRETTDIYGVRDGRLLAARTEVRYLERRRRRGARLELDSGSSVAAGLRQLDISLDSIVTTEQLAGRLVMHGPRVARGTARARPSHPGSQRGPGRWTVRFGESGPYDEPPAEDRAVRQPLPIGEKARPAMGGPPLVRGTSDRGKQQPGNRGQRLGSSGGVGDFATIGETLAAAAEGDPISSSGAEDVTIRALLSELCHDVARPGRVSGKAVKTIRGTEGTFHRLRVGDHRVMYHVVDSDRVVLVLGVIDRADLERWLRSR